MRTARSHQVSVGWNNSRRCYLLAKIFEVLGTVAEWEVAEWEEAEWEEAEKFQASLVWKTYRFRSRADQRLGYLQSWKLMSDIVTADDIVLYKFSLE